MIDTVEAICPCGHTQAAHHFGCEALPNEGCRCTAIYPEDGSAPWLPAGLRLPQVGDRVRVGEIDGECAAHAEFSEPESRRATVGERGVVTATDDATHAGHPYLVRLGHQVAMGGRRYIITRGRFAAVELEILADDDGTGG